MPYEVYLLKGTQSYAATPAPEQVYLALEKKAVMLRTAVNDSCQLFWSLFCSHQWSLQASVLKPCFSAEVGIHRIEPTRKIGKMKSWVSQTQYAKKTEPDPLWPVDFTRWPSQAAFQPKLFDDCIFVN